MGTISRRDLLASSAAAVASGLLGSGRDAGALPVRAARAPAAPPSAAPPRLIVRGDDMGYAHAGNEALIRCHTAGIETSIEVLVPSPWFPEAVRMLADTPTVDVGVHLTLSSEWDTVKWRPVSNAASLRDADGYFYPMIYRNPNYPQRALVEQAWRLDDVEREFRAQIALAKQRIPRVSHVSSHMYCTEMRPDVNAVVQTLAREYGLDGRITPEALGVTGAGYVGAHATSDEKVAGFLRMLDGLEAGKTYLFVDHPGLDTPELRAIHHVGYEQVAVDRQGVTDTWTSPRVRERVRARGIQLISYRDLRP